MATRKQRLRAEAAASSAGNPLEKAMAKPKAPKKQARGK
jgi:hypothetical protein